MKIRTITTGFPFEEGFSEERFASLARKTSQIKQDFEDQSYDVQTIRMSTEPWDSYIKKESELSKVAECFYQWTQAHHIDYFNLGPVKTPEKIRWLPHIITNAPNGFCTTQICDSHHVSYEAAWETAKLIKQLSIVTPNGFANLRFAALCNVKPLTPFYPASYHEGIASFGIGLENSDLLYTAFEQAKNIRTAQHHLKLLFEETYKSVEHIALKSARKHKLSFCGSDVSISSGVGRKESIAYGFEHLNLGVFGGPGTLSIAKIVTGTLQDIPVKKTGYCGLMLPVLEDHGLATRNTEGYLSITKLLLYSSVCGTGLDTIPLPGDITVESLYAILLDVAFLSIKLQKPLSARLMPIPGKKAGEQTTFDFPYFVNSAIMTP
ncbi:MAG: DUF711 family protein [Candidatus Thermoplasmatota archaeon]|nr:DUF711 family protein [Candidatus Thermoplasmatota archaeon]